MVANEKIDWLYSIIFFLLGLFLLFVCNVFDFYYEWTSFLGFMVVISSINVPTALRRKKQIQKINELRKELNLSIEEVRAMADIGKYDLVNWDWKNAFISPRKLYLLEDTLEKMYLIKFDKEFEMK
ncbi:helix-turn-helix domain-containing protein [Enterococcus gallinarum]|nr:helix-turn-helix domain-containing protein [Enterococcus gallinarum]MDT2679469.1 helix-turn-helix domain-containing protein [Enterococcus gallinarum]